MAKSLYSVILMDEVVKEIDRQAMIQNTSRSNLINHILAQYVSYTTPEMRINDVFNTIEQLMKSAEADMVPYVAPHQSTMSLKSSLEYRYRPTIKYEVELYESEEGDSIGRLSVAFRTQSEALINKMNEFFKVWSRTESKLRPTAGIGYALYDGKFVRSINPSKNRDYTSSELANALSKYIRLFDGCMKNYLTGKFTETDIQNSIKAYIVKEVLV